MLQLPHALSCKARTRQGKEKKKKKPLSKRGVRSDVDVIIVMCGGGEASRGLWSSGSMRDSPFPLICNKVTMSYPGTLPYRK